MPIQHENRGNDERIWLKIDGCWLTEHDKSLITTGSMLNDHHINFAQKLLHKQFPLADGLFNTLLQHKQSLSKIKKGLQIIHDHKRFHWVVASNHLECENDEGNILHLYDSVYSSVNEETREVINNLFDCSEIVLAKTQKQAGSKDCGAFAIAIATNILFDSSDSGLVRQDTLRSHLLSCFEEFHMSRFP